MKKEIEVILPYLVRSSNEKPWYVEYKCFREKTEKLERFRIYKGFNERNSVAEREFRAAGAAFLVPPATGAFELLHENSAIAMIIIKSRFFMG